MGATPLAITTYYLHPDPGISMRPVPLRETGGAGEGHHFIKKYFLQNEKNYVNWNVAIPDFPKSYWNFNNVASGGTIYTIFPVRFSRAGIVFP